MKVTNARMFHPGPHWAIGGSVGDYPDPSAACNEVRGVGHRGLVSHVPGFGCW